MQQIIENLNKNEKKFLLCILETGNLNDTEIAKKTKMSKASCSRIRKKLEKEVIEEYIPIIDLYGCGIEIFVVLTFRWSHFNNKEITKKFFSELENDPNVIFLANGEGANIGSVIFLGFSNIDEFYVYFKKLRQEYDSFINNMSYLILPSNKVIKNDFTEIIRYKLKEYIGGKIE